MTSQVSTVRSPDGTMLLRRRWAARGPAWASVLLVHGIAEHGGRYERTGSLLAEAGLDVQAYDLRGHGRSGGRAVWVDFWDRYLDDVAWQLAALRETGRPTLLFGHSMGGLIALTYAESDRPEPDTLVLSAPAISAAIPRWQWLAAPLLGRVLPTLVIANPFDVGQLAHDPTVGEAYDADPLVRRGTTARLGMEFFAAMKRSRRDLGRLRVPTLVIHGGEDTLVLPAVSEPLARLPGVVRRVYPGLRHETLNEPQGPAIVTEIVTWARERLRVAA